MQTLKWVLLIWDIGKNGWMMDPKWLQAARGGFVPVQQLDSGAAELGGHRTHVGSICSELSRLLAAFMPFPWSSGQNSSYLEWKPGQRYIHQDPESIGWVYPRRPQVSEGWRWTTPECLCALGVHRPHNCTWGRKAKQTLAKLGSVAVELAVLFWGRPGRGNQCSIM